MMWIDTAEGRRLVYEYAQQLITELSPDELPLFDELANEYYSNPTPPDTSTKPTDDLLGLGLSETLVAITPAVIAAVTAFLTYILTEAIKTVGDETSNVVKRRIHALFTRRNKSAKRDTRLTKTQLKTIRTTVYNTLIVYGLRPDQADLVADAIVGDMTLKSRRKQGAR